MRLDLRFLRTILIWAAIATGLGVFFLAAVLESGILTPHIVAMVNERLASAGELRVATSSIYWRPWSGLTLNDVHLSIPREYGAPPAPLTPPAARPSFVADPRSYVLSVNHVEVGYRFSGLIFGRPRLQRVKVVRPDLDLAELARWNARLSEIRGDAAGTEERGIQERFRDSGFAIRRLEIVEGRVKGDQGPLFTGLGLTGSLDGRGATWKLEVDHAGGRLTADRIDEDVQVTGDLALADGALLLDGLHLTAAGGRVSFEGRLNPWGPSTSHILTTGYAIPLARVGSWIGLEHNLLSGNLEFRFLTTGTPDSLELNGTLSGIDDAGNDREIQFFATRRGDLLGLTSLRVSAGESSIELHGHVVLEEPPRVDGAADFRNLDPAYLLGEPDLARLTGLDGNVRFQGRGLTRETFDGSAQVEITRGEMFGLTIDRASAHATLKDAELVLNGARLERGASVIDGVGSIDADNQVAAEFTGTVDLSDVEEVAEDEAALEGSASAEVRVIGPLLNPALEAILRFEGATVLGARAGKLEVVLGSEGLGEGGPLVATATGRNIGYVDQVIPRGTASGSWHKGQVNVTNLRLESDKRGELRLTGNLGVSRSGQLDGRVNQLEIWSPGRQVRWSNEGPISIRRRERHLTVSGLDLRSGTGQVTARVSIEPGGAAAVEATANGVDLAVFSPFLLLPEPLGGRLRLDANATVSADTVAAYIEIDLAEGSYGDDSLERVRGRVHVRDDRVVFEEVDFRTSFATGSITGSVLSPEPFRQMLADSSSRGRILDQLVFEGVEFALDAPELDRLDVTLPVLEWPGGHGSVVASLDGPASAPHIEYRVGLTDGHLGLEPLTSFAAQGSFDGAELTIRTATLTSGKGTLEADGVLPILWSPARPKPRFNDDLEADLRFRSESFPVRSLTALLDFFEITRGRARVDGRLAGYPGDMYLEGSFVVEEGVLTIPTFQDPLIEGRVVGIAGPDGIEITSARFTDGLGGQVSGSGRLDIRNFKLLDIGIDISGQNYHYRGVPGLTGEGSGSVRISMRQAKDGRRVPYFTGSLDVTRADMDERIMTPPGMAGVPRVPEGISIPPESVRLVAQGTDLSPPVVLLLADIDFAADNNVWFRSGGTEIEMAGRVRFHIRENAIGVTGRVRSLRGIYSVLNADFDVEKAEIQFIDPAQPLASYLDAEAKARVPGEEIRVLVTGPIGDPNFEWITPSGLSEAEVYEFLAFRVRRSEADPQDQGVLNEAFLASLGGFVASRFGREITRELGFDTLDLEVEGASTRVGVGKRFGSDFFVKYTQQVSADPTQQDQVQSDLERMERQLLVEYRLSQIFQLQGETGRIAGTDYLNVDLMAEWGY